MSQVEVLVMEKNASALGRRSNPAKGTGSILFEKRSLSNQPNDSSQRLVHSVARQNLASAIEHGSGRKSLSESLLVDPNSLSTNISLRRQFDNEEEYNPDVRMDKNAEDEGSFPQVKLKVSI